ncbi:hypothetical protein M1N86_00710 [Dehalococcoidia bacterium]|nr:hypothetical protein [Dehalococcoidia bacterium]
MYDDEIILKALEENWILIQTIRISEKEYIEMADFTEVSSYFDLKMNVLHQKIQVLSRLLRTYPDRLTNTFVVVTEKQIRFVRR